MIFAVSLCEKPLSPCQVKVSVPLSVATVENAMNGLARDRREQVGAEDLHAVVAAGEALDDVARQHAGHPHPAR